MLHNFLKAKLEELTDETEVWFQQDGATAYTAKKTINALTKMFPSHAVFLRADVGWPARSPDLSHCDYFFWGYAKAEVYKHRPTTRVGSIHFFLIFKFKFIDFEKIRFKFKFIDFEKTKFKFMKNL